MPILKGTTSLIAMALVFLANSSYMYVDVEASSHPASPPAESWVQVVGDGFGDINNLGISAFHVFQDQIYAATNQLDNSGGTLVLGPDPAQLWRSPDGQSWSQVSAFSPPLGSSVQGIFFMADSGETTPQYFYLAAGSTIYRSTDGTTWTQINGVGSGFDPAGNKAMAGLALKETAGILYLYAGTANDNGAQIWRIPFDSNSGWEKVLDFASEDPSVIVITYLYVWRNTLYAGTLSVGPGGAHIYTSASGNLDSWVKNPGVGNGFGDPNNINVAAIIAFKGRLYVSTQNRATGGQLWRSSDGQLWDQVVGDGFGNPLNQELHRLSVAQGQLWVTTFTAAPAATQVWRSRGGFTFVQSNTDGFGDLNTTSGFPVIAKFQGNVYWGGQNKVTGAQIWRTSVPFPRWKTRPSRDSEQFSPTCGSLGGS